MKSHWMQASNISRGSRSRMSWFPNRPIRLTAISPGTYRSTSFSGITNAAGAITRLQTDLLATGVAFNGTATTGRLDAYGVTLDSSLLATAKTLSFSSPSLNGSPTFSYWYMYSLANILQLQVRINGTLQGVPSVLNAFNSEWRQVTIPLSSGINTIQFDTNTNTIAIVLDDFAIDG